MFYPLRLLLLSMLVGCCCQLPRHRLLSQEEVLVEEVGQAYSTGLFADSCWPEGKWWKIFRDPCLDYLIESALFYNPSMEIAASKIRRAQSEVRLAASSLWPILSGFADIIPQLYTRTGIFPPNTGLPIPFNYAETDLDLKLDWDLDLWGKNQNTLNSQRDLFFAEVLNARTTELLLSIAVAESYFTLKTAKQIENLAQKIVENREKKEQLVQLRVTHKLDNILSSLSSRQDALNRQNVYQEAKRVRELQEHHLYTLVASGEPLPSMECDLNLDLFPFPLPTCIALDSLSRRPDIQAQLWKIQSTEHLVKVANAGYYPDINLSALVGLSTIFPEKLFNPASTTYSIGPALHLPIFSAGEIEAKMDEAAENFRIEIELYNANILQALQDVKDAFTSVERYNNKWIASIQRAESTKASLNILKIRLQKLSTALDFLDQEEIELVAQSDLIAIEANLVISLLELVKAVGG